MAVKVESIVRSLLVVAIVTFLVGCAQSTPQTESGQSVPESEETAAQTEQTTPKNVSNTEEIHLVAPVSLTDREPSGQWYTTEGPTWLEISDGGTHEEMEFEEIDIIYDYFGLEEHDGKSGEREHPDSLHVTLSDGTEGDITNPDVINDLWNRVLYMRLSPDLAMADSDTLDTNELVFSWDSGRTQTFTFRGHTALAVDGALFPIIEDSRTGAEVFSGYSVSRMENYKYPDTVFDIARMVIEDGLGKRKVFFIKSGSTTMGYSRDSFSWDAADDGMVETYSVEHVKGSDDSQGGVRIKATNMSDPSSCIIEGAERVYVVEMMRDDESNYIYPQITYQPEDGGDRAMCSIKMEDGELVVSYQ